MSAARPRGNRTARSKAAQAAKQLPTAILLKKKSECDALALTIVERLIDPEVDVEWMLKKLGQIKREHMEDVIEERALGKLCGYVLCDNPLTKIINKKYQISTLRNKVYDIEKVKNFCSYFCYSAADYLLSQIETSPLWLRDEEEIPEFKILPKEVKKSRSVSPPGVEISLINIEVPTDSCQSASAEKKPENSSNLSRNSPNLNTKNDEIDVRTTKQDQTLENLEEINQNQADKYENREAPSTTAQFPDLKRMSLSDKSPEPSRETEKPLSKTRLPPVQKKSKAAPIEPLTARLEKNFVEWITKETIGFLHGEESAKQQIIEQATRADKYKEICRKLNHIQLEEEKEERSLTADTSELKPAPHFSILQEQAKNLEIKVRAFYGGQISYEAPAADSTTKDDPDIFLPLTDAYDAQALRRKIFLDKLGKMMPELLQTLSGGVEYPYTPTRLTNLKILINTFALSATNISFKTAEWTLVTLLIIKLLAIVDTEIKSLLSSNQAAMYMSMILSTYQLKSNYLDCLINSQTSPPSEGDEKKNFST